MSVNENRFNKLIREEDEVSRLGIRVKYLCLSLMCENHKQLHGKLLGFERAKEIYCLTAVPKNCRCGISQVRVDELGQPIDARLVEKVRSQVHKAHA